MIYKVETEAIITMYIDAESEELALEQADEKLLYFTDDVDVRCQVVEVKDEDYSRSGLARQQRAQSGSPFVLRKNPQDCKRKRS